MKENEWEWSKKTTTDKQIDEFIEQMEKLVLEKAKERFGHDDHNLGPVLVCLINKVKYESYVPFLVEHRHLVETDEEKMERLYAIFLNLSTAFHNLETEMNIMRMKQLQKRKGEKDD